MHKVGAGRRKKKKKEFAGSKLIFPCWSFCMQNKFSLERQGAAIKRYIYFCVLTHTKLFREHVGRGEGVYISPVVEKRGQISVDFGVLVSLPWSSPVHLGPHRGITYVSSAVLYD